MLRRLSIALAALAGIASSCGSGDAPSHEPGTQDGAGGEPDGAAGVTGGSSGASGSPTRGSGGTPSEIPEVTPAPPSPPDLRQSVPSDWTDPMHPPDPDLSWEGWRRHPALLKGCRGVYVPDAIDERFAHVEWQPCPSSYPFQCLELVRHWDPEQVYPHPGAGGVFAGGEGPDLYTIAYSYYRAKVHEYVTYDGEGRPVAALRIDGWEGGRSASSDPIVPSVDARFAMTHTKCIEPDRMIGETSTVVPIEHLTELMYSPRTTIHWPESIVSFNHDGQSVQAFVTSGDILAVMLVGAAAAVDLATGEVARITPDSAGVDWQPSHVVGRTAFVFRGTPDTEIWVSHDLGMATPLLEVPGGSIGGFVTDGQIMVWSEMTDPVRPEVNEWGRNDVYVAPYETDPARVLKRWVGLVPTGWGGLWLSNGHVIGGDYTRAQRWYVLRLADGAWFELPLPGDWWMRSFFFAGPSDIWFVTHTGSLGGTRGERPGLLRVPYSELTPRDYGAGGPP
jgi:hypothetical protein